MNIAIAFLCIPDSSWIVVGILSLVLLVAAFVFDYCCSILKAPIFWSALTVIGCLIFSLLYIFVFTATANKGMPVSYVKLNLLFDSPLSLLTICIGLAAYTSTLLTKLREAITTQKSKTEVVDAMKPIDPHLDETGRAAKEKENIKALLKLNVHMEDYVWLVWADRLLIVTGVLLMITLALWVREEECHSNQLLVIAMLMAIVLYFAVLHIRQWIKHA